jgi:hypothetical protein
MQNRVMRVRGSAGFKTAEAFKENGSAVSDNDSNATARVEVSDKLKSNGLAWAPKALLKAPHTNATRPA